MTNGWGSSTTYSDLLPSIRALEKALTPEPGYYTFTEAALYGFNIQRGWLLKVYETPAGGRSFSYITPERWEVIPTGAVLSEMGISVGEGVTYRSPEGIDYTPEQLEQLRLEEPKELATLTIPQEPTYIADPNEIADAIYLQVEEAARTGVVPSEIERLLRKLFPMDRDISALVQWAQQNPEEFKQEIIEYQTRLTEEQARVQQAITVVFPNLTLADVQTTLNAMVVYPGMSFEDTIATQELQAEFIDNLKAIGRTPEMESFIKAIFPSADADFLNSIFGTTGLAIAEIPETEPFAVFLPMIGYIRNLTAEEKQAAPTWVKAFASGIGDVISGIAGTARWLGYQDIGEGLSKEAEKFHYQYAYEDTLGEFEFADLLNPDFYAQKISRAVPFALSLAPLAVGGFYAGAGIASAAGLGTIWSTVIGGFAGAVLSRPAESALEAGQQYDDAIARGRTEAEAKAEADEVFRNNMLLAGADAFEIAIALAPTPKWVPATLLKSGLVRTVTIGGKMVVVGLSEGGEEVYQDMIQRHARGEEWQLDPISKEVFAIGAVMGMGMGLGGDVISSIMARSKQIMPASMKQNFNEYVDEFEAEGFRTDQAELRALNKIAETPEGQKVVGQAIEDVKAEVVTPITPEVTVPSVELRPIAARPGEGYEIVVSGRVVGELDFRSTESLGITGNMLVDIEVFPEMQRQGIATQALDQLMLISEEQKRPLYSGLLKPEGELWLRGLEERGVIKLEQQDQKLLGYLISRPEVKPPAVKAPPEEFTIGYGHPLYQTLLRDTISRPELEGRREFWQRQANQWKEKVEKAEPQYKETAQSQLEIYEENIREADKLLAKPPAVKAPPEVPELAPVEEAPLPPEGATKRVFDRIQFEEPRPGFKDKILRGWHKFNVAMVDDLFALKKLTDQLQKGGVKLSFEENPYLMARMLKGITGKANVFLEQGTFGRQFWKMEKGKAKPNFTGESLETILQEVKEPVIWRDFSTYLVSVRSLELAELPTPIETGINKEDAGAAISELEAQYPRFPQLAQRIYSYQSHLMDYIEESGLISHDLREKLAAKYFAYVPFYRVFTELQSKGMMGKKMANIAKPIKRIKGSEREIINPLESIVKNTYTLINASDRNQIGITLANLVGKYPELAEDFQRVKTPMARIAGVTAKQLGVEIEGLTDEDAEAIIDVFRPSFFTRGDEVTVLINGEKKYYKVDLDLRNALLNLDRETLGTLGKIFGAPARWLRAGATLSPDFMIRNPARDQMTAFAYSRYGFLPGIDWLKGMASVIFKDADYQLYRASGAEHAMLVSMDREYLRKTFKELVEGRKFSFYVKHPMELLRIASEVGEKATRLGEFKKGINRGAVPLEAGYSSRVVSLDFSQAGTTAHAINMLIAFFNANIRGWGRMISSFKENPIRTSFKVFAGITLPSILLYLANRDDDRWKEIPQWQKDLFWIVMTDENIYRIPKPFELGIIFGSMPERFLEWLDNKDPEYFKQSLQNLLEAGSPGFIPTAGLPILEWMTNYSFFRGYSLVPASREKMPPELQYTRYTSEVSKKIGELLKLSPAKIDNLIYGYTAGLGRYVLDVLDKILKGTGISPDIREPSPTLADLPVIKAFVVRNPYGSSGEAVERFYDTLEKYEQGEQYLKEMLELGEQEKFDKYLAEHPELLFFFQFPEDPDKEGIFYSASARYLRRIARELSALSSKQDEIYKSKDISPAEKRRLIDEIDKLKTQITRRALSLLEGEEPQVLQYLIDEAVGKLGTVLEETPLLEPEIYNIRDLRSDFRTILEGITLADLEGMEGIDSLAKAYLKSKEIENIIAPLINKSIYQYDPERREGTSFEDYYLAWQQGILEDETLSQLSRRQLELLRGYYASGKSDKYLEEHPELKINPREQWLKAHPLENAQLAVQGEAKILSMEAYNEVKRLINELDIPDSALLERTLPPEGSVENYFKYLEIVDEFSSNSWEAQLLMVQDDDLREWLGRELVETPISILQMSVDNRESFELYQAYGDRDSENYIADDDKRAEARALLLFTTPPNGTLGELSDFGKVYFQKQAYTEGYSESLWEQYAEYSALPEWGSWRDRYLLEHPELYREYTNPDIGNHELIDESLVRPLARDEVYGQFIEQFRAWENTGGMTTEQAQAYHDRLDLTTKDGVSFLEARYRVKGYDIGLPEQHIDDYVEWTIHSPKKEDDPWFSRKGNESETFYGDDWWLMEHPEFERAMVQLYKDTNGKEGWQRMRDYSKVPSREVFGLYKIYKALPDDYWRRMNFRLEHPDLDAWLVLKKGYSPAQAPGAGGEGGAGRQGWLDYLEQQNLLEEWMEKYLR